jgi:thymidylate synthase ThyX
MNTTTLHAHVQRRRFADHTWAAVKRWMPVVWRRAWSASAGPRPSDPARAAAYEAQRVRALAQRYSQTDPGFAADLYAAAARHEGLYAD